MASLLSWDTWKKAVDVVSADLSELTAVVTDAVEGAVEGVVKDAGGLRGAASEQQREQEEEEEEEAEGGGCRGKSDEQGDGGAASGDSAVLTLMREEATYTAEIAGKDAGAFAAWCDALEMRGGLTSSHARSRMDELLDDPVGYECYELLVPGIVSMETFFHRYLFRLERLLAQQQKTAPGNEGEKVRKTEGERSRAKMEGGGTSGDVKVVGQLVAEPVSREPAVLQEIETENNNIAADDGAAPAPVAADLDKEEDDNEEGVNPSSGLELPAENPITDAVPPGEQSSGEAMPELTVVSTKMDLPVPEAEEWELWE